MILCAGKKEEQIELLELGSSGIHVAEYLTSLPPKELLREKLHRAIVLARERLEMSGAAASECSKCSERGEESRTGERQPREERIAENVGKVEEGD